jgi:TMEM175 potassium channel family protein
MNEGNNGGEPRAEMARRANPERLGAFSDAVIAVIITIMVLELKAPERPAFAALASLWPTALSYAVSYLFVAIIWINHHHLMRFVRKPSNRSHQVEFPASVLVSLVPFATQWAARTRLSSAPVVIWAFAFVCVDFAYLAFEHAVMA